MAFRFRHLYAFGQQNKGLFLKEFNRGVTRESKCYVKNTRAPPQLSVSQLSWSLMSLNISNIKTPPHVNPPNSRIPLPLPLPLNELIEPPKIIGIISYEDHIPTKTVDEPTTNGPILEKQAARLIVIRRKKMKKHKLRKLRKKMRFEWGKRRQKRELKKEKMFQGDLLEKIKLAQSFDPAKYASEKIAKANEYELPQVWHGVKYPDFIMKQLVEEEERKKKEKEADERRKASMSPYVRDYLKNIPK